MFRGDLQSGSEMWEPNLLGAVALTHLRTETLTQRHNRLLQLLRLFEQRGAAAICFRDRQQQRPLGDAATMPEARCVTTRIDDPPVDAVKPRPG